MKTNGTSLDMGVAHGGCTGVCFFVLSNCVCALLHLSSLFNRRHAMMLVEPLSCKLILSRHCILGKCPRVCVARRCELESSISSPFLANQSVVSIFGILLHSKKSIWQREKLAFKGTFWLVARESSLVFLLTVMQHPPVQDLQGN